MSLVVVGDTLLDIDLASSARRQRRRPTAGAGDCFAATVAVRLMSGDRGADAVWSGVDAASRFLAAGGAAAFDPQALREGDRS
jgi:hydroxymethylpyrimidine/phosphomethylpyrimidine kinase